MRLLEGDGLIVMRLFGVGPVLGFQLKSDYEGAQAAVLAEVIRIVRVHCAHPRGAVGVALAALLAQLAGFAELVLVLLIRDPAVAALADVLVPLGAFHAGLAVRAAAVLGVDLAALLAQAALLAGLLGQQAFLALLAGRVAIDAVDDAGIIVVHALVHRTEAGVTQRAVHRVTVIVCTVIAEAAGVADGYLRRIRESTEAAKSSV